MSERTKRMRGVWLTGHGGPDKLEVRSDIPVPRPGPRDVLIRVAAAGINNTDINTRTAWYSKNEGAGEDASWAGEPLQFPRIQGADVCGRIVAVGEAIDAGRIGERVLIEPCIRESAGHELERPWYLGSECDGGFAEYVVVASRHAYRIESALDDAALASFPCSYSTAENMLRRARVESDQLVLITGASGGVGSAAIQLARMRGARVIAVTSPEKAAQLIQLGAERTLARDQDPVDALSPDSVDVVIDLVAGEHFPKLLDVLRPGGRYAVSGAIGGPLVELDVRTLYLKDLSLFGCTVLDPEVFPSLIGYIEQGRISPVVARTFPLERIAEAQAAFVSKQHVGKLVLTLDVLTDGCLNRNTPSHKQGRGCFWTTTIQAFAAVRLIQLLFSRVHRLGDPAVKLGLIGVDPGICMTLDILLAGLAVTHTQILRTDVVVADIHDRKQLGCIRVGIGKCLGCDDTLIVRLKAVVGAVRQRGIDITALPREGAEGDLQPDNILARHEYATHPIRSPGVIEHRFALLVARDGIRNDR